MEGKEYDQEIDDMALLIQALKDAKGSSRQVIAKVGLRWIAQLLRKNADYGASAWKAPVLAPECDAGTAIRVRMSDKVERLNVLLDGKKPEVQESIEDTFSDLGSYCLLELARRERSTLTSDEILEGIRNGQHS